MKLSMHLVSPILICFMLLVATEMGHMPVEANTCKALSQRFKGLSMRLVSTVLMISFMLLVTTEISLVEARLCMTPSKDFRNYCLSSNNCAIICRHERAEFKGGECSGWIRRRCLCTLECPKKKAN
ncbi:hypothetical protein AALP_AA5G012100 [Arabis alpina]|uniref:Knottins-like domain-containing protein n=1 Tax=Arabis alpina TaxID=50452 RepID=A0A087GU77_ARAAL|nr:hypothetical protein AALP_AA5G012100 [Arabis alpina]